MSKKQILTVIALMAMSLVVGVFLTTDYGQVPLGLAGPGDVTLGADHPPVAQSTEVNALNDAFVAVSRAVRSEVVSITVTSGTTPASSEEEDQYDPFQLFEGQMPHEMPQQGSGSGVIVSANGYILTNNHVVEPAANDGKITVDLHDGREFPATLVGRDPLTDLAVVKIAAKDLPVAAFGNSDQLEVGQLVVAVGNPLGLTSTVTQGIVSALGRGQLHLNTDAQGYGVEDFIQTDAAINPGNSGGGLFDLNGALVGINSAIATRTGYYQGYGFAIPINLAQSVAADLIDDGHVNRGYIGVQIQNVSQTMARALKLSDPHGVLVQHVMPGSAAEDAGLRMGDVILKVDDQAVSTSNHLQSLVARRRAGDVVKLEISRNGSVMEKSLKLKPRDESEPTRKVAADRSERNDREDAGVESMPELGMDVAPLNAELKDQLGVRSGVVVADLQPYGEARTQGLMKNDVILSVNRTPVNSVREFDDIVKKANPGDPLLLQVHGTNGSTRLVALEVQK